MLSYQHIYHAGNLADVHKHGLLAWMLAYMTAKDKPISYLETHAGRGLYDLASVEAVKTGEAKAGIETVEQLFAPDHPYVTALQAVRGAHGPSAYAGSPVLAGELLRATDTMHLAELHPQEHAALEFNMSPYPARCIRQSGWEMAMAVTPPTPRRGMILIDPSYEVKEDYAFIPGFIAKLRRKWNVGVIALWYPVLANGAQAQMAGQLKGLNDADALHHEVRFPAAKEGHGMIGSGMFVLNPPYGLKEEAARLSSLFDTL